MEVINGWTVIATYFLVILIVLGLHRNKGQTTKLSFLVGDRNVNWVLTAFSMAATWIWAPALFVASEQAYRHGWAGVFWFVVPNVMALIIFAHFAQKMRNRYEHGWTFSGYIKEKYSKRVHNIFLVETFGLQTMSLAVQLLAGAAIFNKITGIPFAQTTLVLVAIPISYTLISGIRSSIITDFYKMASIVLILAIGIPMLIINSDGYALQGISGQYTSLFSGSGLELTLSFGIPTTIGLLSGAFGDQMFWQRVFSIKKERVKKTMLLSAAIFVTVPLSMSLFGFYAAGSNLQIADTQLTNVFAVIEFTPHWYLYLFFALILSGLISTVDSILNAVSSTAGHDLVQRFRPKASDRTVLRICRLSMIAVSVIAVSIANIPNITIIHLFLFYGTLRSSVMLPTIYGSVGKRMSEKGLYYGLLIAIGVGTPLFMFARLNSITWLIAAASIFTITVAGVLPLIIDRDKRI